MRTVAVMHLAGAGGPAQHVRPWLEALATRGELEVVAARPGATLDLYRPFARTTTVDYAPLTLPTGFLGSVRLGWSLVRQTARFHRHFRASRPDLVVVVTAMLPFAALAARLTGTPTIVYAAELFDQGFLRSRSRTAGARVLAWATALTASGIASCSEAVERQFPKRGGRRIHRTIAPGVDAEAFRGDGRSFRAAYGLTSAQPCIAVIGNLTPGRGQDVVIRALPELRAAFPRVHCVIAGTSLERGRDIGFADALVQLADQLGVADRVTFAGFVDPVSDLLAAADVVVNPARCNEAFGRVAIEALAAGAPVIATRVGAVPEILRDGEHALLVAPDDPAAVAEAVERLCTDAELSRRLVEAGRDLVLRTYREDRAVAEFARLVDDVLGLSARHPATALR